MIEKTLLFKPINKVKDNWDKVGKQFRVKGHCPPLYFFHFDCYQIHADYVILFKVGTTYLYRVRHLPSTYVSTEILKQNWEQILKQLIQIFLLMSIFLFIKLMSQGCHHKWGLGALQPPSYKYHWNSTTLNHDYIP